MQVLPLFSKMVQYITQQQSIEIDAKLFKSYSLEQLMELAGLSVALAINSHLKELCKPNATILVVCGGGNNGGDGLVCARHLKLMGYQVRVSCPISKFEHLIQQCLLVGCKTELPNKETLETYIEESKFDYIVDAVFGFGFKGEPRHPWDEILGVVGKAKNVISIDVPSGSIIDGDTTAFDPYMIISLTLPKLCTRNFKGFHYLGGHFLFESLCRDLELEMPIFDGDYMITKL